MSLLFFLVYVKERNIAYKLEKICSGLESEKIKDKSEKWWIIVFIKVKIKGPLIVSVALCISFKEFIYLV
jgi:hypothetical protein